MSKTAVILGGTVPHCELVRQLRGRGYYTVLVDYTADPPAKEFADEHVRESTLDKEKVLEIAKEKRASLVISTCVDQANVTCCYVAEQLGLPHPYSYQTSLDVTDKSRMKAIMQAHGITTAKYVHVHDYEEVIHTDLQYPLMVKPADSNSANGVKKAYDEKQLEFYVQEAIRISRNGQAIIEEYVQGIEFSAYCVVTDQEAKLIMSQERISVIDGDDKVIKCYASITPTSFPESVSSQIEIIATQIARAFHLNNTPLFFQGIVCKDSISVIEFAPRVGGGISSQTIKLATGYDIISAAIDSFLGEPISLNGLHEIDKIYAVNQLYGKNGTYSHTTGGETLLKSGVIDLLFFYKKEGAIIDEKSASSSRVGVFLVSAAAKDEILTKINNAFQALSVFDQSGNDILRRDMNLSVMWTKI